VATHKILEFDVLANLTGGSWCGWWSRELRNNLEVLFGVLCYPSRSSFTLFAESCLNAPLVCHNPRVSLSNAQRPVIRCYIRPISRVSCRRRRLAAGNSVTSMKRKRIIAGRLFEQAFTIVSYTSRDTPIPIASRRIIPSPDAHSAVPIAILYLYPSEAESGTFNSVHNCV
jgi:hypothetical protein